MATVLIAAGGTGGHLFPAFALARELASRDRSRRLAFVGAGRTTAKEAVVEAGFDWHVVPSRGLPRRGLFGLVPFAWDLARGMIASKRLVRRLKPAVAVGFGNYGSVAPLYAAHRRGVPVVIHEANALPGKANRLLARWADAVAVQFEEAASTFAGARAASIDVVGMPVRDELLELPETAAARRAYELDEETFTLLVMGGSQGAHRLNEVMCYALPLLGALEQPLQVIHLCGQMDEPMVRDAYKQHPIRAAVRAFEPEMARAYAAADAAFCRAGAATVAELAVTGRPSLLVPFPYATERHQTANARMVEQHGAARLVEEYALGPDTVVDFVKDLSDGTTRDTLARAARHLARPNATQRLADIVERHLS